jgi:hypothetical protein
MDGERNLAIRRRLRSGTRLYHPVQGNAAQIMAYREMNQEAIEAGSEAAVLDYFGNSETGPKAIQLDESLGEIGDILHQLQTTFTASPVPLELMGFGHDLNRDILKEKLQSYEQAIPSVTDWLEKQVLEPLVDLQLLLMGIWPGNVEYEILWARDRQTEAELAQQANDAVSARSEAVTEAVKAAQGLMSIGAQENAVDAMLRQMLEPLGLDIPARVIQPAMPAQLAANAPAVKVNGNGRVLARVY